MATIPSNIARLHASLPGLRLQPGASVTPVTQRLQFPSPRPTLRTASLFSLAKEPEDARLTGGTRSLDRRLLALNLTAPFAKAKPVRSAPAPQRMAAPVRPTAA
ncbi:MAG TPA: hypothetical protein VN612_03480 [Acidobacteriaceae bacterium]|nr:hypothetical protein [Acidobacteriaceae bacterium]